MISRIAFLLLPIMFYDRDGRPKRCPECGSSMIDDKVEDILDACYGPVTEYSCWCVSCNSIVGYWAHGSYDPAFSKRPTAGWVLRGGKCQKS